MISVASRSFESKPGVKRARQCISLVDYMYSVARQFWTSLLLVKLTLLFILKLQLFLGVGYLPMQVICSNFFLYVGKID